MLGAEHGAAESKSWVEQFRGDWESGLILGIVADTNAAKNDGEQAAA